MFGLLDQLSGRTKGILYALLPVGVVGALLLVFPGRTALVLILALSALLLLGAAALVTWALAMRARRKSALLAEGLTGDPRVPAGLSKAAAEQIRQRFAETFRLMRRQPGMGSDYLYRQPFVILIGETGAGKTTTLRYSGLDFPFGGEQQGVGGTLNCDWWIANQGIVLDTAGKYASELTAEESNREWRKILALLKRFRPRQPINGVIVAIPATALYGAIDDATLRQKIRDKAVELRRRLQELQGELGVRLPVWLVVTKCDRLVGFREFCLEMPGELHNQLLGWSNPAVHDEAVNLSGFMEGLEALYSELCDRRAETFSRRTFAPSESDKLYLFPDVFRRLFTPLRAYVEVLFSRSPYFEPHLFRGVYFTSGTQDLKVIADGIYEPIAGAQEAAEDGEEMMTADYSAARRLAADQFRPQPFFVRDVYTEAVFPESGLVRPVGKVAVRRRNLSIASMAAAGVIALLALGWGIRIARSFDALQTVEDSLSALRGHLVQQDGKERTVARVLDQCREVEDLSRRYAGYAPLSWFAGSPARKCREAADAARWLVAGQVTTRVATLFGERRQSVLARCATVDDMITASRELDGEGQRIYALLGEWSEAVRGRARTEPPKHVRELEERLKDFLGGTRPDETRLTDLAGWPVLAGNLAVPTGLEAGEAQDKAWQEQWQRVWDATVKASDLQAFLDAMLELQAAVIALEAGAGADDFAACFRRVSDAVDAVEAVAARTRSADGAAEAGAPEPLAFDLSRARAALREQLTRPLEALRADGCRFVVGRDTLDDLSRNAGGQADAASLRIDARYAETLEQAFFKRLFRRSGDDGARIEAEAQFTALVAAVRELMQCAREVHTQLAAAPGNGASRQEDALLWPAWVRPMADPAPLGVVASRADSARDVVARLQALDGGDAAGTAADAVRRTFAQSWARPVLKTLIVPQRIAPEPREFTREALARYREAFVRCNTAREALRKACAGSAADGAVPRGENAADSFFARYVEESAGAVSAYIAQLDDVYGTYGDEALTGLWNDLARKPESPFGLFRVLGSQEAVTWRVPEGRGKNDAAADAAAVLVKVLQAAARDGDLKRLRAQFDRELLSDALEAVKALRCKDAQLKERAASYLERCAGPGFKTAAALVDTWPACFHPEYRGVDDEAQFIRLCFLDPACTLAEGQEDAYAERLASRYAFVGQRPEGTEEKRLAAGFRDALKLDAALTEFDGTGAVERADGKWTGEPLMPVRTFYETLKAGWRRKLQEDAARDMREIYRDLDVACVDLGTAAARGGEGAVPGPAAPGRAMPRWDRQRVQAVLGRIHRFLEPEAARRRVQSASQLAAWTSENTLQEIKAPGVEAAAGERKAWSDTAKALADTLRSLHVVSAFFSSEPDTVREIHRLRACYFVKVSGRDSDELIRRVCFGDPRPMDKGVVGYRQALPSGDVEIGPGRLALCLYPMAHVTRLAADGLRAVDDYYALPPGEEQGTLFSLLGGARARGMGLGGHDRCYEWSRNFEVTDRSGATSECEFLLQIEVMESGDSEARLEIPWIGIRGQESATRRLAALQETFRGK